ncbi:amidohydrolase family protein [Marinihelvus fidelis]|uniref:Amidohydrolase family protein n=2 Tax=Marinihelvus fidelis TaxID=2613842 RepID=A0A5N0TLM0_9GAMM|nr:amidohydrolase family protein [Marinihelvus fidelis]
MLVSGAAGAAETDRWNVLVSGVVIGQVTVERDGNQYEVDYEYRNNGRGPTKEESITIDEAGLPTTWHIDGHTTFGNQVAERFALEDGVARWTDSTGSTEQAPGEPTLYVAQEGSPFALWIYANALLKDLDMSLPALPGGELRLTELQPVSVAGDSGETQVMAYALSGTELDPAYFLLDDEQAFFGYFSPRFVVIREGFEGNETALNELAANLAAQHYADIQARVKHDYGKPVRVANVHVFDPREMQLSGLKDVVVKGNRVVAVVDAGTVTAGDEVVIEGSGGTLLPGLWDMHGHVGQDDALLNIAAGVTSIRDMGNRNDVLDELIEKISSGVVAGPRIVRSGMIEGRSEFNNNNGMLVGNQQEALDAVDWYADRGFWQIKIYNSMRGEWVPAMVERAHERGLRVAGHVPAFDRANAMIEAGYDELTHINQVMLGYVLESDEDTRTLLRLTALKRLQDLDLDAGEVQHTIDLMVEHDVAVDPTMAIHEALLLGRNGETRAGVRDYIDHMPVGVQRQARVAWADISTPEDDAAYRAAYDRILGTIRMMREAGVFIVFGTDMGGAFNQHREMEIYQQAGFSAGEILRRATLDMAEYTGQGDDLGAIEAGKLADFFLVPGNPLDDLKAIKTISMVMADGTVYYPTEIYQAVGILPFTDLPAVMGAE